MRKKNKDMVYSDDGIKVKHDRISIIVTLICFIMSVILIALGVMMFV